MAKRPALSRAILGIGIALLLGVGGSSVSGADSAEDSDATEPLGIAMENYDYPWRVDFFPVELEGKRARMAYMDVDPKGEGAGPAVVLMHGKNFFGAYWEETIAALSDAGYRVVVPDQIGFGKSSKPNIHYSFHRLAQNTRDLLRHLDVEEAAVVGHSMGGMLAVRFALMFPDMTTHLVLENPIGLEDYRAEVPYRPIEATYEQVLGYTKEGLIDYHKSYYVEWKPEYREYPLVHYRWTLSGEYPRLAWASALTYDMIYTQPIVHELDRLEVPTLLVIGQEDRTSLGSGPELGQYPELGRRAADRIPDATLVELDGVGHIPHLAAVESFHRPLKAFLRSK